MNFCNPEIPGLGSRQSRDSGLVKTAGIPGSRDSGSRDCNPYPHRKILQHRRLRNTHTIS